MEAFSAKEDIGKPGLTGEQQIKVATTNQAIIFTRDVDFLRMASQREHPSIIYVHQTKAKRRRVHKAAESHS